MAFLTIIKEHKLNSLLSQIDTSWTLFLDRDGVINEKIEDDYVRNWEQFKFIPGALKALNTLSKKFGKVFIVTNQQGIGKKLMTKNDLLSLHSQMLKTIENAGGRVDRIYFAPNLSSEKSEMRKPGIGMALQAQKDFPGIDFSKSLMVGDSYHDMKFGKRAGMKTAFISKDIIPPELIDLQVDSLIALADLFN